MIYSKNAHKEQWVCLMIGDSLNDHDGPLNNQCKRFVNLVSDDLLYDHYDLQL